MLADVRHAARSLRRSPWYSGTVIGVIAIGMALATTVFAVVDGVLFKPLPYPRASELFAVTGGFQKGQRSGIVVAPRNLADWAAAAPGVTMAAIRFGGTSPPAGDLQEWTPSSAQVDAHLFDVLGVRPLIGGFLPADFETATTTTPAVISYGLWQGRFGGRPDIVGQTLAVPAPSTTVYRVAGVLPRDFLFPTRGRAQPNLLTPLVIPPGSRDDLRYRVVTGIARLPPSSTFSDDQSRMDAAAKAEASDWVPRPNEGTPVFDHAGLTPLETVLTGQQRPVFLLIFSAAAVLVLLGCVNVSGLMASRVHDRVREIAVRRALGAGSREIAWMLLIESAMLVTTGTLVGLTIARPLMTLILRLLPDAMGLLKPPSLDLRVVAFAGLSSTVAAVVVSIWPIWRSMRASLSFAMADGSQPTARVRSVGRVVVITAQIALGLTLALGGALLVGSLVRVWQTNPGFHADTLLVLQARLPKGTTQEHAQRLDGFLSDVRSLPGVAAAGATESPMLTGSHMMNAFMDGSTVAVTPGFLDAVGPTLLEGRLLTREEIASGAFVALVSQRVARRIAPGQSAIGQQIKGYSDGSARLFTVVGIVADARFSSWDDSSLGQVYAPYVLASDEQLRATIVVQTSGRPDAVLASLVPFLKNAAGDVRVTSMTTATHLLDESVRQRRLESWLFGSFAASALALIGVGIFGLMAMTTARRTREIGIRVALGAARTGVVGLLLREQLMAVVLGLAMGACLSAWAVRFLKTYLYELTVYDTRVWAVATVLIFSTAALGALIPALRASSVDPVQALRVE